MDVKKLSDESIAKMIRGLSKEKARRLLEKRKAALTKEQEEMAEFCKQTLDPLIVDLRSLRTKYPSLHKPIKVAVTLQVSVIDRGCVDLDEDVKQKVCRVPEVKKLMKVAKEEDCLMENMMQACRKSGYTCSSILDYYQENYTKEDYQLLLDSI